MKTKIGILTLSDRAFDGTYVDLSGPAIIEVLNEFLESPWEPIYRLVPDDQQRIENELIEMVDKENCCLILTTGGTGPAVRDVTPEATTNVCQKKMPGFGEMMRSVSLQYVPTAILSRQTAGIRGQCLIVNLPGRPRSIRECLEAVFPAIPYCIDLLNGPFLECNEKFIKAFRPPQK